MYFFAPLTNDLGDKARERPRTPTSPRCGWACWTSSPPTWTASTRERPRSPRSCGRWRKPVRECGVPAQPLLDLIEANRQDQRVTRYPAYSDLERYCELSANPVGQIVLYIFGVATPERIALSDNICTALQLAEHWQDVAEDLGNGRIYLPG